MTMCTFAQKGSGWFQSQICVARSREPIRRHARCANPYVHKYVNTHMCVHSRFEGELGSELRSRPIASKMGSRTDSVDHQRQLFENPPEVDGRACHGGDVLCTCCDKNTGENELEGLGHGRSLSTAFVY